MSAFQDAAAEAGILREVLAGIVTACVALPLCIAAGVLAYAPLGSDRAAEGAVAGIISAILGGILASLVRRSSFVTTIPTNPNSLILASLLAGLLTAFSGDVGLALAALASCALLAGLWQVLIGVAGLARVVKLVPYTVFAGFVSGIGVLIVFGQIPVLLAIPSIGEITSVGLGSIPGLPSHWCWYRP